jgi:hypothetical protein
MQQDKQKPDVPKWISNLIGIVAFIVIFVLIGWIIYYLIDWLVDLGELFN